MTLVDKKVETLGKNGKVIYLTGKQLKEAKIKYSEYTFLEVEPINSIPKNQKAYILNK